MRAVVEGLADIEVGRDCSWTEATSAQPRLARNVPATTDTSFQGCSTTSAFTPDV